MPVCVRTVLPCSCGIKRRDSIYWFLVDSACRWHISRASRLQRKGAHEQPRVAKKVLKFEFFLLSRQVPGPHVPLGQGASDCRSSDTAQPACKQSEGSSGSMTCVFVRRCNRAEVHPDIWRRILAICLSLPRRRLRSNIAAGLKKGREGKGREGKRELKSDEQPRAVCRLGKRRCAAVRALLENAIL